MQSTKKIGTVIEAMRQRGYRVFVAHSRYIPDIERPGVNGVVHIGDCMTRKEFEKLVKEQGCVGHNQNTKFGDAIANVHGFTHVKIIGPNNKEYTGKHNFGSSERFTKRIGLMSAFGQAMKKAKKDFFELNSISS